MARRSADDGLDLGPAQYYALVNIDELGPIRMGELAKTLKVAESTATRVIDRLVEAGVVARLPDPSDRRTVSVALTPKGRGLLARARRRRSRIMAGLLEVLEPEERDQLVRLFEKLAWAEGV
jgi:DNA-binding MarR family transcriptional regulator